MARSKPFNEASHALNELSYALALLESDNAKLRELVRHLRECTRHNVCAACKYAGGVCDFDYDLRELRIEVDE